MHALLRLVLGSQNAERLNRLTDVARELGDSRNDLVNTVSAQHVRDGGDYVPVGEPEPGRVLIESAPAHCMLTTFTVDPDIDGGSIVRIETVWYSGGLQGAVERMVAPRMLRRVYEQELRLLDRYVRQPKAELASAAA